MRAAAIPAAVLALTPAVMMAQSANSGTVTGTVTDPSGAVIPGATVTVADTASSAKRTATTNKDGLYVMPDVPSGTYNVTVVKPGFSQDQIVGLVVEVGQQANASFKLAVGAENTVISVEASNADLQTMNASTGQTVDNALVQSLPALGRDAATFATLQPGVSPTGQVAGTTADQASFSLDGGNNTSDMDGTQGVYTGNNTNSTTGGQLGAGAGGVIPTPQDSVEEFKVSTSGQTADFNNSSGSNVQIVTKRGHDQVHGSVYEYYLDNNFNANSWQNNFGGSGYTAKPSYHYSRFGAAAGGPVLPNLLGGKTYLFANYEGFRYPLAQTYERIVPSYAYLQQQQLTFTTTFSQAALLAADPRKVGMNATLRNYYQTTMPVSPVSNSGSVGATGASYAGIFDQSCGALSTSYCDGVNTIGYRANVQTPQSSNFLATRLDHDFGAKWHLNSSYRYYNLQNLTANQVDIGGQIAGDTMGVPKALTPRPQQPWYFVVGLTTNISSSLTNDFHYSYLRNAWQWKGAGAPAQVSGAGGAIEPLGESAYSTLGQYAMTPYNVNAQYIRTRIWDGKDNFFRDDLTDLKGNHFIQVGFQFQHNFDYHQRTDNGASINYTPTYQLGDSGGGGYISYTGLAAGGLPTTTAAERILDSYYGMVTDTQVVNTYTNNNGTLTLNPSLTPVAANTSIPYYNAYVTDTWHAKPTLTINYGISYAIEMPPQERNGNQIMMTDTSGNAIYLDNFLAQRKAAGAAGTIYNPIIAFTPVHSVDGGTRKYPYNPFYGAVSPRVALAWTPKVDSEALNKLFGNGATVVRVGYGRLYGRINGDTQILNPLLSPGLLLGTRCQYLQHSTTSANGTCNQSGYTDTTAFRFGATSAGGDGLSPLTASAAAPTTLPEPYRPGVDGPGVSIASPLDPSLRPNDVDTFNVSIQRQVNSKMLVEVGYIGRIIHHEYIMKNPNQLPTNLVLGGQSFVSAYDAVETALGCTNSAAVCSKTTLSGIAAQPFFETALGGPTSAFCTGKASCTAALLANSTILSYFRTQSLFSLWSKLDNNVSGTGATATTPQWNFARSLMGTATSNATYGGAGQLSTGASIGTPDGWSNYNGGYVSFKVSGWHGLTAQENLTYSRALGLGAYNQSSSSIAAEDNYNLWQQYGRQSFDQKLIFNTFLVYDTPWYKSQSGVIGRLAGGWTISPVISAGTGQPLVCTTNNSGQNFGGEDGNTFTDSENCIFKGPVANTMHTYRGVTGGNDALGIAVGTNYKAPGGSAAVNVFTNPALQYDGVRPPILGIDGRDGGSGPLSGLGYVNMDLSVRKILKVYGRYSMEFSGTATNVLNHLDFANPSLSLQSVTSFGVTKTQGNTPRQIQGGARFNF